MENVKNIVVLLEFEDGSVRQVLTTRPQKDAALYVLRDDDGNLAVTNEMEPITFIFKPKE